MLLLSGARCLTIGGHSAGKVGIAAEDGVVGFLIDASHILHVGIGRCAAVGPLVGDEVQYMGRIDKESDDAILNGNTDLSGAVTTDGQAAGSAN